MAILIVVEGPNRGLAISLVPGEMIVGRDRKSEIYIPDPSISRRHASLSLAPNREVTLTDLGSTNATYANGVRVINSVQLRSGDQIRMGESIMMLLHESALSDPGDDLRPGGKRTRGPLSFSDTDKLSADVALPTATISAMSVSSPPRLQYLIGSSPELARVADLVLRCAPLETTMLVSGESGTGKELVAEALHRLSPRRDAPFVVVNCATLEPALLESELFGHERGAFTGAVMRKLGKLEIARSGTVFLDEVGELPLEAQAKLLRAIDKREFQRLGGQDTLRTAARFVAATHRDLPKLIKDGRFREDLYFRLVVVEIKLPPLRDRIEDVGPLCSHFIGELRQKIPTRVTKLTPAAQAKLEAYRFPGNVRELKNVIEHCLIFCEDDAIDVHHLPLEIRGASGGSAGPLGSDSGPIPALAGGVPQGNGELATLEDVERTHVYQALVASNWNKSKAARLLAIDRNTLHAKIKRHNLEQS